jgi:hypothetical protein
LNKKGQDEFKTIVTESIDEALSNLGEKAKTAIYSCLQEKFLLSKSDIPNRLDDFSDALEKVFSVTTARYLEILIMAKLHEKVKCVYKYDGPSWLVPDLSFKKYVVLLKLAYDNSNQKTHNMEIFVDSTYEGDQVIEG